MKTNPGGEVAPANIVGRDDLIAQLRETLEHQSVVLVAERRIGKTSIIKKMDPAGICGPPLSRRAAIRRHYEKGHQ